MLWSRSGITLAILRKILTETESQIGEIIEGLDSYLNGDPKAHWEKSFSSEVLGRAIRDHEASVLVWPKQNLDSLVVIYLDYGPSFALVNKIYQVEKSRLCEEVGCDPAPSLVSVLRSEPGTFARLLNAIDVSQQLRSANWSELEVELDFRLEASAAAARQKRIQREKTAEQQRERSRERRERRNVEAFRGAIAHRASQRLQRVRQLWFEVGLASRRFEQEIAEHKRILDFVSSRKHLTNFEYVERLNAEVFPEQLDPRWLSVQYKSEIDFGSDSRRPLEDILAEMARYAPKEFLEIYIRLNLIFIQQANDLGSPLDRSYYLFSKFYPNLSKSFFDRVITRGSWNVIPVELNPGTKLIYARLDHLGSLSNNPAKWLQTFRLLLEGVSREELFAFDKHAGDAWDVAARW